MRTQRLRGAQIETATEPTYYQRPELLINFP
jgi:hypothetical protein